MAITIDPTTPLVGEVVTLSSSSAGGNTTRWQIVTVPDESSLVEGDFLLDAAGEYVDTFTPDAFGEYAFKAYGYTNFTTVAQHANDTAVERTKFVGTESGTVHVAGYADLPIHTLNGNGCTLRLTVQNYSIMAAECINPFNEASRVALLTSGVTSALSAVVGADVDEGLSLVGDSNELRSKFEAHRVRTTAALHAAADNTNVVEAMRAVDREDAIRLVNELADKIGAHQVAGASGTRWHRASDDTANGRAVAKATTTAGAHVLLVDLSFRVYERHRVLLTVDSAFDIHAVTDTTNALAASGLLDDVIVAIIDAFVDTTPTAPAGEPEGIMFLAQNQGFTIT